MASCGADLYDIASGARKSASSCSLSVSYRYTGTRMLCPSSPIIVAAFGYEVEGGEPDLVFFSPPLLSSAGTYTFTGLQAGSYGLLLFVDCDGDIYPSAGEPYEFYENMKDNPTEIHLDANLSLSVTFDDAYIWVSGFYENFDDGIAQNWIDDGSGRWTCSGVKYEMRGSKTASYAWSFYDKEYSDFAYQVSVEQNNGDPNSRRGIFFRAANPPGFKYGALDGYVLWIDSNRNWGLEKNCGGAFNPITNGVSGSLYQGIGGSNTMRVECRGPNIKIYLNGTHVFELDDPMFPSGKVGVFGFDRYGTYSPPDEFWFDDAWVK